MNLLDLVLKGSPDAVALLDEHDQPWTYDDLRSQVAHLAGYLEQSTEIGDRCLIQTDDGLFWVTAFLACLHAGRIAVPISTECPDLTLERLLHDCSPRVAFLDGRCCEGIRARCGDETLMITAEDQDAQDTICWTEASASLPSEHTVAADEGTVAAILYSGQSASEARGAVISHANLIASTQALMERLRLTRNDRCLIAVGLHSCFGISSAVATLRAGGAVIVERQPWSADAIEGRLARDAATGITASLPVCESLAARNEAIPTLRYVEQVEGRAPADLMARLQRRFPQAAIHAMYGMAEAGGALASVPPELAITKASSVGEPLSHVRLQLLDEYGHVLSAGQTGEIVAESPAIARGYWQDLRLSHHVFRKGRLHTGDLGTLDADGSIHLAGRSTQAASAVAGTAHVQQTLALFPGLKDSAVLTRHDDALGDVAVLVAVHSRGEEIRQQLLEFCAARLPFNERPHEVYFRAHLPRDVSGQIDHEALQEQIELEHHHAPTWTDRLQAPDEPLQA